MAILQNKKTKQSVLLRSYHVFGRHPGSSNTMLTNLESSRLHASFLWNGVSWEVKDSSSNGTFVNTKVIKSGSKVNVVVGDTICFGSLKAEDWELIDDGAPKSMLVPIKADAQIIELDGIIALPNESSPEITIYQNHKKQWLCDNFCEVAVLESGDKINTNDRIWYFLQAETPEETKQATQFLNNIIPEVKVNFNVSKNEEHVKLTLKIQSETLDLGERVHHYLLLFLARKRLLDQQCGVLEEEQGWIDKDLLCKQIGFDENHLNIQIYRLRKQLLKEKPLIKELLQIVKRRRGEIRFGFELIKIESLTC